jgi:hypothetical protein
MLPVEASSCAPLFLSHALNLSPMSGSAISLAPQTETQLSRFARQGYDEESINLKIFLIRTLLLLIYK